MSSVRSTDPASCWPANGDEPAAGPTLRLSFRGDQAAVRVSLEKIDQILREAGLPEPLIHRAIIVLGEVFNNIVEHAYSGGRDGRIDLRLRIAPDQVCCDVRDTGVAMPAGPLPGERFPYVDPDDAMNWPEGGFGWALVRELTEDLVYDRSEGENTLRFRIVPEQP